MKPESSNRDAELRRLLVATADAPAPARPRRGLLAAALAGCVLLGGVAGAVSATAVSQVSNGTDPSATWVLSSARPNSVLLSPVFHLAGSGDGSLQIGEAPVGASGVVIVTRCESAGSLDQVLDGEWVGGVVCNDGSSGGGGWVNRVEGGGQHLLEINAASDAHYQVWAAWVKEPPMPEASAQQLAEIADGVVTREEYLAAFNRFAGCLGAAGYDMSGFPQDDPILRYSIPGAAVSDGSDERCYIQQFEQVDLAWQIANQDLSETTEMMRKCLIENGITPAEHRVDVDAQFEEAGIDFVKDCMGL